MGGAMAMAMAMAMGGAMALAMRVKDEWNGRSRRHSLFWRRPRC
jgi:hypothetical protein